MQEQLNQTLFNTVTYGLSFAEIMELESMSKMVSKDVILLYEILHSDFYSKEELSNDDKTFLEDKYKRAQGFLERTLYLRSKLKPYIDSYFKTVPSTYTEEPED